MQTKLTLRLDEEIIQQAKIYAKKRHLSLSKVIEDYFRSLSASVSPAKNDAPLPERTKNLKGILAGSRVSKKDYQVYLSRKHG